MIPRNKKGLLEGHDWIELVEGWFCSECKYLETKEKPGKFSKMFYEEEK